MNPHRAQRIDEACDKIEAILRDLPPDDGEKALIDVCSAYLLTLAYEQCAKDRRLVPIKEGVYALNAFREKVNLPPPKREQGKPCGLQYKFGMNVLNELQGRLR
jgi:hypothetical protein